jgi:cell wall-associated NlpC family hydrolase
LKDLSKYIGIPFKSCGRDELGIDCYGLIRMVLRNEYGKDLPDFYYKDALDKTAINKLININRPLLAGEKIKVPEPGDIAVIRYRGKPCHIGIYVGEKKVLHIKQGTDSVLERVNSVHLKARIEGYYRID